MKHLFSNLLVSAPNDGGIIALIDDEVSHIDHSNTTGLDLHEDTLVRGMQPDSLRIYSADATLEFPLEVSLGDIHDVLAVGDRVYVVGTRGNTVAELSADGEVLRRWVKGSQDDSSHINCLAQWNGRVVFSAFGDFAATRGYKAGSRGNGFVQDLLSSQRLISGLSQPHSLTVHGPNLLLANSEEHEIVEYDPGGRALRRKVLGGYTRGILVRDDILYVGLSAPRHVDQPIYGTSEILALDAGSWQELGRLSLPTREVYTIVSVASSIELAKWVARISSDSSARQATALAVADFRNANSTQNNEELSAQLNQAQAAHENLLETDEASRQAVVSALSDLSDARSELSAAIVHLKVAEADVSRLQEEVSQLQQEVSQLQQEVSGARFETSRILASTAWRMTLPLQRLVRFGKNGQSNALDFAYGAYRSLPLPRLLRQRISGSLAKAMPTLHSTMIGHLHQKAVRTPLGEASLAMLQPDAGRPVFSVVIPIYDRTWELRDAIQSVLHQTMRNIELILVTDGSPPETMAVVDEFRGDARVRVFSFPCSSGTAVRGRNKGILEARAPYIAFLDSDDICEPDRLERSFEILEDGNDVVYGAWRAKLDGSRDVGGLVDGQVVISPQCDLAMLREVCVPCQSTVAARRSRLMDVGLLKPAMRYREDHELWVRLASTGAKFKATNAVLATLRLHQGNNELSFKADDAKWAELLKREYAILPPRPQKIAFVVAGLGISGGLAVILKHAEALMAAGHDVTLLDCSSSRPEPQHWARSSTVPIVAWQNLAPLLHTPFDAVFATFWTTVDAVQALPAGRKLYFVQSDERLFYADAGTKALVERTYREPMEYVAVASWIAAFLREQFGQAAHVVPNGIDLRDFTEIAGLRGSGQRPRVLIEGPISVPFKGVADAYSAVEGLDCDVWMVSSAGRPEPSWKLDRFVSGASIGQMVELYSACDVLLKLSRIESFCLPALEAMACGCAVVVGEVAGGMEFIDNGRNAVVVPAGDVAAARRAVVDLLADRRRRADLVAAGRLTAVEWNVEKSAAAMLAVVQQGAPALA